MTARQTSGPAPAKRTVTLTRSFEAPDELVFQAWTDPKLLAQWWGPKGFTNPVCELDLRRGGAIRIEMKSPDGTVYPMTGAFQEIAKNERLVFTTGAVPDAKGSPQLVGRTIVVFADEDGETTLTLQSTATALPPASQALEGMEAGWTQSLERLAALIAKLAR
jgi:uncharacterized protein YndB with AHSA1/START domain